MVNRCASRLFRTALGTLYAAHGLRLLRCRNRRAPSLARRRHERRPEGQSYRAYRARAEPKVNESLGKSLLQLPTLQIVISKPARYRFGLAHFERAVGSPRLAQSDMAHQVPMAVPKEEADHKQEGQPPRYDCNGQY
eukprot:scaffold27248_cov133-Isochrysis_galbana.AAC.16